MKRTQSILSLLAHNTFVLIAVVVMLISVLGIGGVWYTNHLVTGITLKVFGVVETGVSIADQGVTMALNRVIESRQELALMQEDIHTLGKHFQENHPALVALNERLDQRFGPSIETIQTSLEPVQGALTSIHTTLMVVNSIPYFQEKVPNLGKIQNTLEDVAGLSADVQQLRTTLRAMAEGKADTLTSQTEELLLRVLQRIDARLARMQTNLEDLLDQIHILQTHIQTKKQQVLFWYNLISVVLTLLFLWIIYSQIVVIRLHIAQLRDRANI